MKFQIGLSVEGLRLPNAEELAEEVENLSFTNVAKATNHIVKTYGNGMKRFFEVFVED